MGKGSWRVSCWFPRPSKDPLKLHSFPTKEKGITPTFYQVTTQGFSEDHCAKAQEETAEYHAKNRSSRKICFAFKLDWETTTASCLLTLISCAITLEIHSSQVL